MRNSQVQPRGQPDPDARFPQAESQTAAQFKRSLASQVDTLLALIYVLLALSVIVSLFGIVNTLVLSIFERTRELGMLRAIGTSRRQIRQMIRYESIITALIGGVLGIGLGIVISLILAATALSGSGFVLVIPVGTVIILFILAGLAGLARRRLARATRRQGQHPRGDRDGVGVLGGARNRFAIPARRRRDYAPKSNACQSPRRSYPSAW